MRAIMFLTFCLSLGLLASAFGMPCASAHLTSLTCLLIAPLPRFALRGLLQSDMTFFCEMGRSERSSRRAGPADSRDEVMSDCARPRKPSSPVDVERTTRHSAAAHSAVLPRSE